MSVNDLCAVDTQFEQKRGESVHTYVCPQGQTTCAQGDFGMHVGEPVKCKLNGQTVRGEVIAVDQSEVEEQGGTWKVQFEDGRTMECGEKQLRKLLVKTNRAQRKQIDHILVSNR